MTKLSSVILVTVLSVVATPAFATWWGSSSDRCNGTNNCNEERTYNNTHTNNTTNNTTTHNVDNSRTLNNTANGGDGGQGGTGVGVGVGVAHGGDARVGNTSSRSTSGVNRSGNSASLSGAYAGGSEVSRSGNSDVDNRNNLSNDSQSSARQQQGILASGNSFNHVDGGDSSARQGQIGINSSENTNRNRTGDQSTVVTDASFDAGNTVIIGGGYEQEGGGSTLSPTADSNVGDVSSRSRSRVGDTTSTASNGDQVTDISGNNSSVGDINDGDVTVNNYGMSDEAARALGQPDIVDVDSRDQSVENQDIDASTTINDNSVYEAPKMSAATAAPVFSSVCTSGASGQGRAFGFGIAVTSSVCEHLMLADAFNAVGNVEMVSKHLEWASKRARFRGTLSQFRSALTLGIL